MTTMPRPQFSLRSLLVLTAFVAVGCWAGHVIVARHQRALRIESLCVEIESDRKLIETTDCGTFAMGMTEAIRRLEGELAELERGQ
jgi:hypothetical protein